MLKVIRLESKRILTDRSTYLLAVVFLVFMAVSFFKTAAEPQKNLSEEIRQTIWQLEELEITAENEKRIVDVQGTPDDRKGKAILVEVYQQILDIWNDLSREFQVYQEGRMSENPFNESYIKASIRSSLLWSALEGTAESGDENLCALYAEKLDWLDIQIPDYLTFSEYMKNTNQETRHLSFESEKVQIEKLLLDLERDYPLATASSRGPGLYVRNYFALSSISGFMLPVVLIAYAFMNTMLLKRCRTDLYSRTLPVSAWQFYWIQLGAIFLCAASVFLITFMLGFLASGLCFGWGDLGQLVPVDPSFWNTGLGASPEYASAEMNTPFFNSTLAGVSYYAASLHWISAGVWTVLVLLVQIWLLFLQILSVCTVSFLFSQAASLFIGSVWIILLCTLRFRFSVFSLLPLFWPSPVDLFYGGYGVGWGIWLISSLGYAAAAIGLSKACVGRKDI